MTSWIGLDPYETMLLVDTKEKRLLVILKIYLELLECDPILTLFLELLLLLLHAIVQGYLRSIQTTHVNEIFQHFTFREG